MAGLLIFAFFTWALIAFIVNYRRWGRSRIRAAEARAAQERARAAQAEEARRAERRALAGRYNQLQRAVMACAVVVAGLAGVAGCTIFLVVPLHDVPKEVEPKEEKEGEEKPVDPTQPQSPPGPTVVPPVVVVVPTASPPEEGEDEEKPEEEEEEEDPPPAPQPGEPIPPNLAPTPVYPMGAPNPASEHDGGEDPNLARISRIEVYESPFFAGDEHPSVPDGSCVGDCFALWDESTARRRSYMPPKAVEWEPGVQENQGVFLQSTGDDPDRGLWIRVKKHRREVSVLLYEVKGNGANSNIIRVVSTPPRADDDTEGTGLWEIELKKASSSSTFSPRQKELSLSNNTVYFNTIYSLFNRSAAPDYLSLQLVGGAQSGDRAPFIKRSFDRGRDTIRLTVKTHFYGNPGYGGVRYWVSVGSVGTRQGYRIFPADAGDLRTDGMTCSSDPEWECTQTVSLCDESSDIPDWWLTENIDVDSAGMCLQARSALAAGELVQITAQPIVKGTADGQELPGKSARIILSEESDS